MLSKTGQERKRYSLIAVKINDTSLKALRRM